MLSSIHPFSMHTFLFIVNAIDAPEATAAFELQVNPEGQEINPEAEDQQAGHEEPEEEIECPNHEPASFMKGPIVVRPLVMLNACLTLSWPDNSFRPRSLVV